MRINYWITLGAGRDIKWHRARSYHQICVCLGVVSLLVCVCCCLTRLLKLTQVRRLAHTDAMRYVYRSPDSVRIEVATRRHAECARLFVLPPSRKCYTIACTLEKVLKNNKRTKHTHAERCYLRTHAHAQEKTATAATGRPFETQTQLYKYSIK